MQSFGKYSKFSQLAILLCIHWACAIYYQAAEFRHWIPNACICNLWSLPHRKLSKGPTCTEQFPPNFLKQNFLKWKMRNFDWLMNSEFCFKKRDYPTIRTYNHVQFDSSALNLMYLYKWGIFFEDLNFMLIYALIFFFRLIFFLELV